MSCPAISDRTLKHDIEPVDPDLMLERLASLPISEWSYAAHDGDARHVGPMAQDFHAAFGLGDSDRTIHPVDASGVVMAALQALERRVSALDERNHEIERDNDALRTRLDALDGEASQCR